MTAQAIAHESLSRAVSGNSTANYHPIIEGFMSRGIAVDDIKPRENVFTYNAWRALGRQVRRGEHGVKATTFVPVKGKKATTETPGKDGFKMPRTVTVFHVSQTDEIRAYCSSCDNAPCICEIDSSEQDAYRTELPADQVEAIDAQTTAFVQARMTGRPVSFRYVDGTHETFNA